MELDAILIVAFTGVVAVSTVAYAFLTWRLVSETRRLREVQTEPRVSVRLELAENVTNGGFELVISNEGQGPANDIHFGFEGDPTYFLEHGQQQPMDEIPFIKNGLPYLSPGQQFRFLLGWLFGDAFKRANEQPWIFAVDYKNVSGESLNDQYTLDFSQFSGLIIGGGPPLVKIEKHLEKLQKDVHHLSTGFRKLGVITQTKEEERRDIEAQRERWNEAQADSAGTDNDSETP